MGRKKDRRKHKGLQIRNRDDLLICAIVLAAGESKRMGEPKLLLPYENRTIIETVLQRIIDSSIDETIVVLGSNRDQLESQIKTFSVQVVVNDQYKLGMLSSVQAGVRAIPDRADAFVVFLGDQPMIPAKVIDDLIEAFRMSDKGIVIPVYQGNNGHPVLISKAYREEIFTLSPEVGLRELMCTHLHDVVRLPVEYSAVCRVINTPEDYRRETGDAASEPAPS